jgi:putative addiction module killer protein
VVQSVEPKILKRFLRGGKSPFTEWLDDLKDVVGRARIRARLLSLEKGNFGKNRALGDGVYELKIDIGPGYRVYYGLEGMNVVLLLCGGSKRNQNRDIEHAKKYWQEYLATS